MTQWGYDNSNEGAQPGNENELDGPKALRDAYAALKKQNEETMAMVSELLAEKKSAQASAVFESLGIPETVRSLAPTDPTEAKAWAETMRTAFGGGNQGGTPPVADNTQAAAPVLPASMQAQFERMTEAGQSGSPLGNLDAAFNAVGDATDIQGLIAAHAQALRNSGG